MDWNILTDILKYCKNHILALGAQASYVVSLVYSLFWLI